MADAVVGGTGDGSSIAPDARNFIVTKSSWKTWRCWLLPVTTMLPHPSTAAATGVLQYGAVLSEYVLQSSWPVDEYLATAKP